MPLTFFSIETAVLFTNMESANLASRIFPVDIDTLALV